MKLKSFSFYLKFITGFGLLFLIGSILTWNDHKKFNDNGVKTTGTVIDLETNASKKPFRLFKPYSPVVSYADKNGNTHEYRPCFLFNLAGYEVGEKVDVYYSVQNFDNARLGGWGGYTSDIIPGVIAGLATLTGLVFLLVRGGVRARNAQLKATGELVKANFDCVKENVHVTINESHPFRIYCSWKDPFTGTTHSFKSAMLLSDPSLAIGADDKLDVYIDRNDPKKYFVDLSFLDAYFSETASL